MREITSEQYELIIDALASVRVQYLSPAGLEKDILLTHLISQLNNFKHPDFNITFGGGTSLIKNHAIINRLSEDLDFKISTKNYMRPAVPKSKLRALHAEIQKKY